LSFGHGAHYRIGANIARLELQSMLAAALDFLPPSAKLLDDQIRWSTRGLMSQMKSLPVDFGPCGATLPS
jgi:cytochrome P450